MADMTNIKGVDFKKLGLITDTSLLDKESKALAGAISKQDERIGVYLLSEIVHIEEHRNPTRLNKFFSAIAGSGARVMAMHTFIQLFANVELPKDDKGKYLSIQQVTGAKHKDGGLKFQRMDEGDKEPYYVYYRMKAENKERLFHPRIKAWQGNTYDQPISLWEIANKNKWWTFAPERTYELPAFNFDTKFEQFLQTAYKAAYTPRKDGDRVQEVKIDKSFLHELAELAVKHGIANPIPESVIDNKEITLDEEDKKIIELAKKAANTNTTEQPTSSTGGEGQEQQQNDAVTPAGSTRKRANG
jgi:hypothetical protein